MPRIAQRHVAAATAAAACALAGVASLSIYGAFVQRSALGLVSHTHDVIQAAQEALSDYKEVPLAARLLAAGAVPGGAERLAKKQAAALADLETLRALTRDNPEQAARLASLEAAEREGIAFNERVAAAALAGRADEARRLLRGQADASLDRVRSAVERVRAAEQTLLVARSARRARADAAARFSLGAALLLAFGGLLGGLWLLRRDLRRIAQGEARLEHSFAQLRAIMDASPDMIVALDTAGRVIGVNRALDEALTKLYGRGVAPGEDYVGLFERDAELQARLRGLWRRALAGEDFTIEFESDATGTASHYELRFSAMKDASGALMGAAMTARDISERKQAELAISRQRQELARSNAELEHFAYIASHDLKEPLRMVVSYTQLLARRYQGKLDKDADEFIQFAVKGASRMHEMIDGLLEYSRADRGFHGAQRVDADKALDRALEDVSAAVEDVQARIERRPLPAVLAAPHLHRVFQNLIVNALKFRKAGAKPNIRISARLDDDVWTFAVADDGIGFAPEHAAQIFGLFKRLHTRAHYPGNGLGLAICRKIVEAHGGRIWAQGKPGDGATFYFTAKAAK